MDWKERVDFGELVGRFDSGDRGKDLLAQLNRAAYDWFHAPWETLPAPSRRTSSEARSVDLEGFFSPDTPPCEIDSPQPRQELLPIEEDDESRSVLSPRPTQTREGYQTPLDDQADMEPESSEAYVEDPLAFLAAMLETMGHRWYLSHGTALYIELPYDPKSDTVSRITFLVDRGQSRFVVLNQSDLAVRQASEADLERHCRAYNRRNTGMIAGLFRPQEGAKPRLKLSTTIPFGQSQDTQPHAETLVRLIKKVGLFWHYMNRSLPI